MECIKLNNEIFLVLESAANLEEHPWIVTEINTNFHNDPRLS